MADLGLSSNAVLFLIVFLIVVRALKIVLNSSFVKEYFATKRTEITEKAKTIQTKIMCDAAALSKEHLPPETKAELDEDNVVYFDELRKKRIDQIFSDQDAEKSENTPPACNDLLSGNEEPEKDIGKLILRLFSKCKDEKGDKTE